jgi:hypothetical protein
VEKGWGSGFCTKMGEPMLVFLLIYHLSPFVCSLFDLQFHLKLIHYSYFLVTISALLMDQQSSLFSL